tara:strand:+ start:562 stop:1143 length:582 start_codon:yes stop_codon:yes gene_type:complete
MNKKVLIQIFLFFTFIFLSIFFYYEYFKKDTQILDISNSQKIDSTKKEESNLISDLRYFSVDDKGNKYEIKSQYGEMGLDNPDIIFMTNVKAKIDIFNSDPIIITSNFAKYNIKNYDTNFEKDVLVKHDDNKVNGENLDLSFQNNLMSMYNNIIYQNPDTKLFADKLEIDLVTKDSKIIMNNKKSKIKIIRKK